MVRPECAYVHFICYSPLLFRLQVQSFDYKCMKVVLKFCPCLSSQTCMPLLYPYPSIYRVRLGVGVLDVCSCWWAWADVIWPGNVGSVIPWSGGERRKGMVRRLVGPVVVGIDSGSVGMGRELVRQGLGDSWFGRHGKGVGSAGSFLVLIQHQWFDGLGLVETW